MPGPRFSSFIYGQNLTDVIITGATMLRAAGASDLITTGSATATSGGTRDASSNNRYRPMPYSKVIQGRDG